MLNTITNLLSLKNLFSILLVVSQYYFSYFIYYVNDFEIYLFLRIFTCCQRVNLMVSGLSQTRWTRNPMYFPIRIKLRGKIDATNVILVNS